MTMETTQKRKYTLGQRVIVGPSRGHNAPVGGAGVITGFDPVWVMHYAVEMDQPFANAHGCNITGQGSLTSPGRGQWIHESVLTLESGHKTKVLTTSRGHEFRDGVKQPSDVPELPFPRPITATEVQDRRLKMEVKYDGQWNVPLEIRDAVKSAGAVPGACIPLEGVFATDPTRKMADFKATNPKDKAATSRLDLSLFPDSALIAGTLGMVEGDCKYGGYNYRIKGVLASTYIAALSRHIIKWWNGQDRDPKTHVPALGSAMACIAILIDAEEHGVLKDNRPPAQDMQELLDDAEETVKHLQTIFPGGPDRFTEEDDWNGAYDNVEGKS